VSARCNAHRLLLVGGWWLAPSRKGRQGGGAFKDLVSPGDEQHGVADMTRSSAAAVPKQTAQPIRLASCAGRLRSPISGLAARAEHSGQPAAVPVGTCTKYQTPSFAQLQVHVHVLVHSGGARLGVLCRATGRLRNCAVRPSCGFACSCHSALRPSHILPLPCFNTEVTHRLNVAP
jgi:hypothetical protein